MVPNIVNVSIMTIDVNPFRLTAAYPYVERKIDALLRSYADVGMWPGGVIGRTRNNRVQCAFGHHRIEAARRFGMTGVPMTIMDITDEQMIQYMGRENLEDYNADFLVMLETWEAATEFCAVVRESTQPLDIAHMLGWTRGDSGSVRLNRTADACYAAHALITGGHLDRTDLTDMSVNSVREICETAQAKIVALEKMGAKTKRPRTEIEKAKTHVGNAAKEVAEDVRKGRVASRDIRGQVSLKSFRSAHTDPRPSPLFEVFGKILADNIARMLNADSASERLEEVRTALPMVTFDDDKRIVQRLDFELDQLGQRAASWRKRLTPTEKKVTRLHVADANKED